MSFNAVKNYYTTNAYFSRTGGKIRKVIVVSQVREGYMNQYPNVMMVAIALNHKVIFSRLYLFTSLFYHDGIDGNVRTLQMRVSC